LLNEYNYFDGVGLTWVGLNPQFAHPYMTNKLFEVQRLLVTLHRKMSQDAV